MTLVMRVEMRDITGILGDLASFSGTPESLGESQHIFSMLIDLFAESLSGRILLGREIISYIFQKNICRLKQMDPWVSND